MTLVHRIKRIKIEQALVRGEPFEGYIAPKTVEPWDLEIKGFYVKATNKMEFVRACYAAEDSIAFAFDPSAKKTYWRMYESKR